MRGRLLAEGTPNDTIRFLVSDTSAEAWGGIRFDSTVASSDSSIISYCALSNGGGAPIRPTGGAAVGGLVATFGFSKLRLSNNVFRFSHADYGGAIACRGADPVIVNSTFNHLSADHGSALWCQRSAPVFAGNQVLNCGGTGGTICLDSASVDITNSTIAHNWTYGLHFKNGAGDTVLNTILWGNQVFSGSLDTSGAIIIDSSSLQVTIADSTSSPDFSHCTIEDDTSGFDLPEALTYTGTVTSLLSSDPEFVAPGSGDLRLQSTSGCINRGWPQTQSVLPFDQWGNTRVSLDTIDIGAFEYPAPTVGTAMFPPSAAPQVISAQRDGIRVRFSLSTPARIAVEVMSMSGRLVKHMLRRCTRAGAQDISVAMHDLPAGVYLVKINSSESPVHACRFVVR